MTQQPVDAELASMLMGCATCRPWAEQDEGPYHRDAQPVRRAVVEDRDGVALQLGVRLVDGSGEPLRDAAVEIWHCDALGRYSGFPPPDSTVEVTADTAPRVAYLPDQTFLRGSQDTDAAGMVEFTTIYPGWYPGRTIHIHLMVHAAGHTFTSQLYFPEDTNERVLTAQPYAQRPGRDTTNGTDEISPTGAAPALVDIGASDDGYRAAICLGLPTDVGRSS